MFSSLIELALQNLLFFALHIENGGAFPRQLSKKEEMECIDKMEAGDVTARNTLIEHNLRLVAYIVRKHYSDSKDQDDLISIGTIGLIRAAETFKTGKAISFSTYAGKCIDNQIKMYFRKTKRQQTEVYMNEPLDTDKDGNPVTMSDFFKDPMCIADEVDLLMDTKKLYSYINSCLDKREKMIICKRYGINTTKGTVSRPLTQKEVAKELDISRSYVSRIEKKALERLRKEFGSECNLSS